MSTKSETIDSTAGAAESFLNSVGDPLHPNSPLGLLVAAYDRLPWTDTRPTETGLYLVDRGDGLPQPGWVPLLVYRDGGGELCGYPLDLWDDCYGDDGVFGFLRLPEVV